MKEKPKFQVNTYIFKLLILDTQSDELDNSSGGTTRQIDIFICYRRSTGSQLASLLKVHLQLRGYKVNEKDIKNVGIL